MSDEFDVIVVGSGPAGTEAALAAAARGARVAMLERASIGGTCLNSGCVPSNAMLEAVAGCRSEATKATLNGALDHAAKVVSVVGRGLRASLTAAGIQLIAGTATAMTAERVVIGEAADRPLHAGSVVLATGADSVLPPYPGTETSECLTWVDCLSLQHVPRSVAVVAGGPLALEAVRLFESLGTHVTLVGRLGLSVMRDLELQQFLKDELVRRKIDVDDASEPIAVERVKGGFRLFLVADSDETAIEADLVVFADFRQPHANAVPAGLSVEHDPRGFVQTAADMSTSVPHVYACGDMTGGPMFAAVARAQGDVAGGNAAGDYRLHRPLIVPTAVHANPEVASVGLTEDEARATDHDVTTGYAEYSGSARAFSLNAEHGIVKLVADAATGEVLGGQIIGAGATESIALISLAMDAEMPIDALAHGGHAHPSLTELVQQASRNAMSQRARSAS